MSFSIGGAKRRVPIRRNTMFFGQEDFNLELEIGEEYLENDANQTVVLYQVDLQNTSVDDIYNEAGKGAISFRPPVEIPVVYDLEDAELKVYEKQQMRGQYVKLGKLTFSVLESTLDKYGCDIKRGDYIGVQIDTERREFFTVADDGRVNYGNASTMYGTKPYFRKVVCVPVDENEFKG